MGLKIEDYMLPCLNKTIFGIECPGCGLQRSLVFLSKAEFKNAFFMYPAIYTLIIFVVFIGIDFFIPIKQENTIKIILIIINLVLIFGNYILKISTH